MDGAEGREGEALTLQQWMARSRKGSGQSSPTRVRKAGTSRPKSCGDRKEGPPGQLSLGSPSAPNQDFKFQGTLLGCKFPSLEVLLFKPGDIIHLSTG